MIFLAASVVLQIICAVHVIRTGRSQLWIMVIVFFSLLGCFAYFVMEVLPGYGSHRYVRAARAGAQARLDPRADLRRAREALEMADTVANRIAEGDALHELGEHGEAVRAYRNALSRMHGVDARTQFKLAQALFELGSYQEVITQLDSMPDAMGSELDRRTYLRARTLAHIGDPTDVRHLFEGVIDRIPGDAARCHYAAFLLEQGDRWRARTVLEAVEVRAKRLDRLQRAQDGAMYRWADEQLKALRAG